MSLPRPSLWRFWRHRREVTSHPLRSSSTAWELRGNVFSSATRISRCMAGDLDCSCGTSKCFMRTVYEPALLSCCPFKYSLQHFFGESFLRIDRPCPCPPWMHGIVHLWLSGHGVASHLLWRNTQSVLHHLWKPLFRNGEMRRRLDIEPGSLPVGPLFLNGMISCCKFPSEACKKYCLLFAICPMAQCSWHSSVMFV